MCFIPTYCGGFHSSHIPIVYRSLETFSSLACAAAPNTKDTPHHCNSVCCPTWQCCAHYAEAISIPLPSPPLVEHLIWLRGIRVFIQSVSKRSDPILRWIDFAHVRYSLRISFRFFMGKSVTPNALLEHD